MLKLACCAIFIFESLSEKMEDFAARAQTILDERRCTFQQVDGNSQRSDLRPHGPSLIRNALLQLNSYSSSEPNENRGSGIAHDFLTPESFVARYGAEMVQVNNGRFGRERRTGFSSVADSISQQDRHRHIFGGDDIGSHTDSRLWMDIHRSLKPALPAFLADFDARRIFSVGTLGSATYTHFHEETWLALLSGAKAWWVAQADQQPIDDQLSTRDPCSLLSSDMLHDEVRANLSFCIQLPGDIVYFGTGQPHATCNLRPFTVGIGAQGRSEGWPPLIRAAHQEDLTAARRALDEGNSTDMNARITSSVKKGQSALHRASHQGNRMLVELLLQRSASATQLYGNAVSPIHIAAQSGHGEVVEVLAGAGSRMRSQDGEGKQPVHYAALGGHATVVELLAGSRASMATAEINGNQPLHYAALAGHSTLVQLLASLRASLSAGNELGRTPMHAAADSGHSAVASLLLSMGADAHVPDGRGVDPIEMAHKRGHTTVAQLLQNLVDFPSIGRPMDEI